MLKTSNNKRLPFLFAAFIGIFFVAAVDGQIKGVRLMGHDGEWKKKYDREKIRNWVGVRTSVASEFQAEVWELVPHLDLATQSETLFPTESHRPPQKVSCVFCSILCALTLFDPGYLLYFISSPMFVQLQRNLIKCLCAMSWSSNDLLCKIPLLTGHDGWSSQMFWLSEAF